ncbi:MAG: tetratricopeptide repeat protein [Pseudomonadota bacterium]
MTLWRRLLHGAALVGALSGCAFSRPDPAHDARMLVDKGRPAEAAAELEAYIRKQPRAIAERRLLIRIYGSMGRADLAEQHALALTTVLGPSSPIPWLELGYSAELSHAFEQALADYDRAAEVAPNDPLGPLTGGLRSARWGELELAEPRLVEALRRDPRNGEAWHALGLVRANQGDLDGATAAYSSGLRADPRAVEDHLGLATVALLRGNPAAALAEYDAIVSARPTFADAHLGRSWALMQLGRLDDAQRALDRARDLGATRRAWLAQARALALLRQRALAPRSMH